MGQDAVLDLRYANRTSDEIAEISVTFRSTVVTNGTMGQSVMPVERTLTVEVKLKPGDTSQSQVKIGPSSPGHGVVQLEGVEFKSGLNWKRDDASACSTRVH